MLVFLQSKDRAKELFHELVYDGIKVNVIHSGRTQEQRDQVGKSLPYTRPDISPHLPFIFLVLGVQIVESFRTGKIWVLLCTDLMARGVDFKGVNMVINYDFPQSVVSYIHRIGRTGRAGRRGEAITLFTEEDFPSLREIANAVKLSGSPVPDWILNMKKMGRKKRQFRETHVPERRSISTVSKYDLNQAKHKKQMVQQSRKRRKAQQDA